MIKHIQLFLLMSNILFAGDDFMSYWKAYDFGILLSIVFLIIIIPIWALAKLVSKDQSNSVFKLLIFIDLAILTVSGISSVIDHHIDTQNYKPNHEFQKPYEYGIYKNNIVVFEEQNDSIIDMYLEDYTYYGGHRNLSYLTKKGLFVYDTSTAYNISSITYIDASMVHPLMGKYSNNSLMLLSQKKDILYFDINSTKFQNNQYEYTLDIPNRLNLHDDYVENAHHKKYYKKEDRSYWSDYEKLYLDHIDIKDTKNIEKIGYHSFLSVMDKENNKIIFHDNGYPIHKFQLTQKPKLAMYDWRKDILYVVYEDENSKIYELTNILSKPYTLAQSRVKTILNELFQPWWKSPKPPYKGISQKDIDKLAKYFKGNSYMNFNYKVKQLEGINTYEVEVTSYVKPTKRLLFQLDTNATHTEIHSITYDKRYFKKELFQTLAKELVNTKTDFDLLKWLIKYESLLGNIKYEFVLDNRDLVDEKKEKLVENIDSTMKNYLWENVKKLDKNLNKQQEIKIFRKKYPCITQYLSDRQKNSSQYYLNLPHPLTDTNVQKSLSNLFYFLRHQCKQKTEIQSTDYKKLLRAIDKSYPFTNDYGLKELLKNMNIDSKRLDIRKIKTKNHKIKKMTPTTYQEMEEKRIQNLKKLTGKYKERYEKALQSNNHPIFATIRFHQNKKFKELLLTLKNLEIKDSDGRTPFFVATSQNNKFAMRALVKQGANINIIDKPKLYTPLSWMVDNDKNIEIVKLLLELGADINYQYEKSETALTVATKGCKNFNMVKLLLRAGANPYLEDKYKSNTATGLKRYCRNKDNYKKMLKLLTENKF